MITRSLFSLSLFCFLAVPSSFAQIPVRKTSSIQGTGAGLVKINPTHLRVSIPIKVSEDIASDATERLRELREELIDRADSLGAIEGSIKAVGFQCTQTAVTSSADPFGRGDGGPGKSTAKCHLVADFALADLDDNEAILAMGSTIVGELASIVPKGSSSRRSYSFSTLPNGITTQQLDAPLGLFWAKVSDQERRKAYKMSINQATQRVDIALDALGVDTTELSRVVSQNGIYSSISLRAKHPVADVLFPAGDDYAISPFPDAVAYEVKLTVTASFDAGLRNSDSAE